MNVFSYYKLSNEEMKQFNEQDETSYEADEYILDFLKELHTINHSRMMEQHKMQYQKHKYHQQQQEQQFLKETYHEHRKKQYKYQQPTYKPAPRDYERKYDRLIEPKDFPIPKTPTFDISEIERQIDTLISEQNTLGFKINNQTDKGISFKNYHESNKLMHGASSIENEKTKTKKRSILVKGLRKVLHIKKR